MPTREFNFSSYSGPLDLLFSLLEEKKLDISEVSLSAVTEQFLSHVRELEKESEVYAEELSDFLFLATRLLLIKARNLVPAFSPEEEEDAETLAAALRRYEVFRRLGRRFSKCFLDERHGFWHEEPPRPPAGFAPPLNFSSERLVNIFKEIMVRLSPPKPIPATTIDRTVSLKDKIMKLRELIKNAEKIMLSQMIDNGSRTELIVTLLAALELGKLSEAEIRQDEPFGDITILSLKKSVV